VESAELTALLHAVRDRVRARYPETSAGATPVALVDLAPLVHARDAALGKVAAIGGVNPRRGGPLNATVQAVKRLVARALDWHIREQVEFNRQTVTALDAAIEALNGVNRSLVEVGNRLAVAEELKDIRAHWTAWRVEWERKLADNEVQFLRSVADLQGGFQHRVTLMEASHRDLLRDQYRNFEGAIERHAVEIQQRLWADLDRIRTEYERLIHYELRTARQRAALPDRALPVPARPEAPEPAFDYGHFAEKFRGPFESIRERLRFYVPYFDGCREVLDVGCGRGEFLDLVPAARGIDLSAECVALCRARGLRAEQADLFEHLASLPEASLDGIFCCQVVEHLPPESLPAFVRLAASRLARGGVLAIETPNPECLAIFATHFYLDPTHTRPVPHPLLAFYMQEFGIGRLELHPLAPAAESLPSLAALPDDFRAAFFGNLDYALIGRKL
jgi:O-antigen chain-terminating methyltransferase